MSLLHSDVWHRISASHAALQPWSGPRLVGVDGSQLRVCGYVKLALKIGTASVSTPVVVVDTLQGRRQGGGGARGAIAPPVLSYGMNT